MIGTFLKSRILRMPWQVFSSDEGAWNGSCAQKKLWVQLGPSEGGVEPERELPPEASVTVCSVGQSKFNSSVGVCYV